MRNIKIIFLLVCIMSFAINSPAYSAASDNINIENLMEDANSGNSDAQFVLGSLYYFGDGVRQDYNKARQWWEKAAEKNDNKAQFILGVMYYKGEGVGKDYNKAKEYFGLACNNGSQEGCALYDKLNK